MAEQIALAPPPLQRTGAQSTDHQLVTAVRRGDDRAFEELYARYHRRISAYVFGMVKDHARAEDVAQEVFMSALRRMRDTDRPIAFKPWIYEIAKNACIDQFRRSRRTDEVSIDGEEGSGLAPADHARLVSADGAPSDRLEAKQSLADLQGAFGGLSESHHQILVMRELEGLSYREIGERMGMSRPSVESTLFRARKRLAEEYEELVSGERCRRVHEIIEVAGAGSLGARDQRRLARHVSHCQPCRRHAALAGVGALVPARTGVRAKVAGLLPLPGFLRTRWLGLGGGSGSGHVANLSTWAATVAPSMDAGWTKAIAVAATVAAAGVGAGVVTPSSPTGLQTPTRAASGSSLGAPAAGSAAVPKLRAPAARRTDASGPTAAQAPVGAGAPVASGGSAVASGPSTPASAGEAPRKPAAHDGAASETAGEVDAKTADTADTAGAVTGAKAPATLPSVRDTTKAVTGAAADTVAKTGEAAGDVITGAEQAAGAQDTRSGDAVKELTGKVAGTLGGG